jgi:hypothetical protein
MSDATDHAQPSTGGGRLRRWLVVFLVVLTCLGVLTSTVAIWTHRTLLDTDEWVDTVGPLASDPAVQQATATYLTDQVMTLLDSQDALKGALPDKFGFLSTPLNGAVRGFVYDALLKWMQTDQFQNLWIKLNEVGHSTAVNVLRGDTRLVETQGGDVTLNFLPLIDNGLKMVQDKVPGFLSGRAIPEITSETPPDQARAELSQAVGKPLPDGFGTVFLYHGDRLEAAQQIVDAFDRTVIALPIVTLLLGAAAIILSTRRRRTLVQLGIGVVLAMGIGVAVIAATRNLVLDEITNPNNRGAASSILSALISSFHTIAWWLIILGAILAGLAFVSGDSSLAVRIRGAVGVGRDAGGDAEPGAFTKAPAFPWLARHRTILFIAGVAVAMIWLVAANPTFGSLLVALVLLALYELAVWRFAAGEPSAAP